MCEKSEQNVREFAWCGLGSEAERKSESGTGPQGDGAGVEGGDDEHQVGVRRGGALPVLYDLAQD